MGNFGTILIAILSAVFFTLLLVTGNTMAISVRERTAELAVLKAVGYSNGFVLRLVLGSTALFDNRYWCYFVIFGRRACLPSRRRRLGI